MLLITPWAQRVLLEESSLWRSELFQGGGLMSLVADTVCMDLSSVCTICFSPYRLWFRFFSSLQEVCLSIRAWALGVKGTELLF